MKWWFNGFNYTHHAYFYLELTMWLVKAFASFQTINAFYLDFKHRTLYRSNGYFLDLNSGNSRANDDLFE